MKGIRTTEVRNFIKAGGEDAMIKCIEQMYERMAAAEQQVQEMVLMQLQMTKIIDQVTSGAGALREQVEKMQRGGPGDDDDLPMASQ